MKRLITILISFMGCISLFGQTVPMVVAGKMHVSGPVYSMGAVHVYSSVDTGKIDIDNTSGAMLRTDHIILYSDNDKDGLIKNANTTGVQGIANTARPEKVTVRKKFTNAAWTYLSLPFAVAKSKVLDAAGNELEEGADYWAYKWNNVERADLADPSHPDIWTEIGAAADPAFVRGHGYQIWSEVGGTGEIDFVTTTNDDIIALFTTGTKNLAYSKYMTDKPWENPSWGAGWAFIGSLSPTTYELKKSSITGYSGIIYFRIATSSLAGVLNSASGFKELALIDNTDSVKLSSYAPFYIQDNSSVTAGNSVPATFTYNTPNGLLLTASQYRSVNEDVTPDLFKFVLSSDENTTFDRFYLGFKNDYKEVYETPKDGMKLSTFYSDQPAVWSVQGGLALVLSGLPMKDEREVKVGFSVPEAGDYTFTVNELNRQKVKNAILVDNIAGKKVDLLQYPYTFTASGKVENDNQRFVLLINSSYTGTPSIEDNAVYAFAKDNLLTVRNLSEGDRVQVLDLAGRTIASGQVKGKEFSVGLSQKGVYVVNVKGAKTSILKVLNK